VEGRHNHQRCHGRLRHCCQIRHLCSAIDAGRRIGSRIIWQLDNISLFYDPVISRARFRRKFTTYMRVHTVQ